MTNGKKDWWVATAWMQQPGCIRHLGGQGTWFVWLAKEGNTVEGCQKELERM